MGPSEWHAAFGRSELKLLDQTTRKLVGLKIAFRMGLKQEYQSLMQRQADLQGDRGYNIVMILEKPEHVMFLHKYLMNNHVSISDPGFFWPMHYLPHVGSLMDKISFHATRFPWITKEDQQKLNYNDFDKSHAVMNRTLKFSVSYYFSKRMMTWVANKVNNGLDALYGSCLERKSTSQCGGDGDMVLEEC